MCDDFAKCLNEKDNFAIYIYKVEEDHVTRSFQSAYMSSLFRIFFSKSAPRLQFLVTILQIYAKSA